MKNTTLSIDIALLLEGTSTGQLASNVSVFFGNERKQKSGSIQLSNVQYIPAVGDNMLIVKAKARGANSAYDVSIQFSNVKFVQKGAQYSVPLEVAGQEVYIIPLKAMQNDVQVHCNCMDFYWRFAMHNNKDGSLIGEPPAPYVKKTDRPPLNPDKVPGSCKHLQKLAEQLRLERILK